MIRFEIVPKGAVPIAVESKPGDVTKLTFADWEQRNVMTAWLTREMRDLLTRMLAE